MKASKFIILFLLMWVSTVLLIKLLFGEISEYEKLFAAVLDVGVILTLLNDL